MRLVTADPARTLLVLSERPHPWALLRDRLAPGMVRVVWLRPEQEAPARCWAAVGEAPATPPALRWPALLWWVGDGGAGRRLGSWRDAAAAAERALGAELAGVRLAPTCGLCLGGAPTAPLPELETLLAAGAAGVATVPGDAPRLRHARAALRRHDLPLALIAGNGAARLEEQRVRPA